MKTQITAFFMAWGMFLSIPCPCKIWDEKARPWQLVYLPVAGLLVGSLWALAAYALGSFDRLPALRAAVLAALPFLLTGFLHLDGFMDCCDAILSRRDLPTRQKILKDSHVGSFAVVCTIFLMLAAFAAFGRACFCFRFFHALPRASACSPAARCRPASTPPALKRRSTSIS